MSKKKQKKTVVASDILFLNTHQVAEDLLDDAFQFVSDSAHLENRFKHLSDQLLKTIEYLEAHVLKHAWISASSHRECLNKITKTKDLAAVCEKFSEFCRKNSHAIVDIIEDFETNKKTRAIAKKLSAKLDAQEKKFKKNEED